MDEKQTDLARRLVAHPKWRWVAGMAANPWPHKPEESERVHLIAHPEGLLPCWGASEKTWYPLKPDATPDLTDYATAAILLRMAFEAAEAGGHCAADGEWSSITLNIMASGRVQHPDWKVDDVGTVAAQALLVAWGEP